MFKICKFKVRYVLQIYGAYLLYNSGKISCMYFSSLKKKNYKLF